MLDKNDTIILDAFKRMPHWQRVEFLKNCMAEVEDLAKALEIRTRRVELMTRLLAESEEMTWEVTNLDGEKKEAKDD